MNIDDLNPWWRTKAIPEAYRNLKTRTLFHEIKPYIDERQIIILTGLRRTGKTVLLYQTIEELFTKGIKPEQILYFDFDLALKTIDELFEEYQQITNVSYKKEQVYVFFDEIQKLDNWQNLLKVWYDLYRNMKFFVSGSSSLFIEKKTKESLAGRSFSFRLSPLTFKEYLLLKGKKEWIDKSLMMKEEIKRELEHYIKTGGFPELLEEKDESKIKKYVKELIIDKIAYIDIPQVFEIDEPELLQRLLQIIAASPGITIDYESLADDLKRNRKTIANYLLYLENAFLIKKIYNFSNNLLTSEKKMKKFYPATTALSFLYNAEKGKIQETIVLQNKELQYFYRRGNKEIDFVEVNGKEIILIEVKSKKDINKKTLQSMVNFIKGTKTSKNVVITEDYEAEEKKEWFEKKVEITYVPLWKWLVQEKMMRYK